MSLRRATVDDVWAVHALERQLFGVDAWSEESVRQELVDARRAAVVACDPDVVGYVVTMASGDAVDLLRIGVHPAHRRYGLGGKLLEAVRTEQRMLLEVSADNVAALAFYAAEGFVELDRRRRYYRHGSDAVVMELPPRT